MRSNFLFFYYLDCFASFKITPNRPSELSLLGNLSVIVMGIHLGNGDIPAAKGVGMQAGCRWSLEQEEWSACTREALVCLHWEVFLLACILREMLGFLQAL